MSKAIKPEDQGWVIYKALMTCFKEDNGYGDYIPRDRLGDGFFESTVATLNIMHDQFTGKPMDILEFVGFLNRVVVSRLVKQAHEEGMKEGKVTRD
jgi:hypothetical protein